jgi:hypothetical protein
LNSYVFRIAPKKSTCTSPHHREGFNSRVERVNEFLGCASGDINERKLLIPAGFSRYGAPVRFDPRSQACGAVAERVG